MPRPGAMIYLISYDIPDNSRRTRLARLLEGHGVRVQWSVFECELSPERYRHLCRLIGGIIVPDEDNVRLYSICATCAAARVRLGVAEPLRLDDPCLFFGG